MRVRATSAFSAVRDCQITALAEGQEVDGDFARYLLETGTLVEPVDDDARALAGDTDTPPNPDDQGGNGQLDISAKVDDVLAWVGDDKDRAREALDAETAKGDKARSSLVTQLTAIVEN